MRPNIRPVGNRGRINLEAAGQIYGRILAGFSQKGPNSSNVLFPLCFPYECMYWKPGIFTDFCTIKFKSYFSTQWPKCLAIFGSKMLKRVGKHWACLVTAVWSSVAEQPTAACHRDVGCHVAAVHPVVALRLLIGHSLNNGSLLVTIWITSPYW